MCVRREKGAPRNTKFLEERNEFILSLQSHSFYNNYEFVLQAFAFANAVTKFRISIFLASSFSMEIIASELNLS